MDLLLYLRAGGRVNVVLLLLSLYLTMVDITKSNRANQQRASWNADRRQLVHYVSLRLLQKEGHYFGTDHLCDGSLISQNVVATAAHCFVDRIRYDGSFLDKSHFAVVLVMYGISHKENLLSFELQELFMQQQRFDLHTYDKDIALAMLRGSMPPVVEPVQLADELLSFTDCRVTGWINDRRDNFTGQLIALAVQVVAQKDCFPNKRPDLQPGSLCASTDSGPSLSACTVDGGAPLLCAGQLVGIGSWSIRCSMPHIKGVYTDVQYYRPWIEEIVARCDQVDKRLVDLNRRNFELDMKQLNELMVKSTGAVHHASYRVSSTCLMVLLAASVRTLLMVLVRSKMPETKYMQIKS